MSFFGKRCDAVAAGKLNIMLLSLSVAQMASQMAIFCVLRSRVVEMEDLGV